MLDFKVVIAVVIAAMVGYAGYQMFKPPEPYSEEKIQAATKTKDGVLQVEWDLLYQLDHETGEAPEEVKALDGQMVKMPGFIVPLTDNISTIKEFLLVPDAQSCIHVPPPPPNLIVYVELENPVPASEISNPTWITGRMQIETTTSQYGSASYKMAGEKLEKFDYSKYQSQ